MTKHPEHNGTTTLTQLEIQQAIAQAPVVNLDEVTNEVIPVKCNYYRDEPMLDDEGEPLLNRQGQPRMRRIAKTRTAHILNKVTLPLYHKVLSLQDTIREMERSEQLEVMTDIVLQVWQLSEPDMTKEELGEAVDGPVIAALFSRFFMSNPSLINRALPDGTITSEEGK